MKLDPCLSPSTKLNFKWIKDLNKRLNTLNQIERGREYIGIDRHRKGLSEQNFPLSLSPLHDTPIQIAGFGRTGLVFLRPKIVKYFLTNK